MHLSWTQELTKIYSHWTIFVLNTWSLYYIRSNRHTSLIVSWIDFCFCDKHYVQNQNEREYREISFTLWFICRPGKQGEESSPRLEAGSEVEQWRNTPCWFASSDFLSLPFYTGQDHLSRMAPLPSRELVPPTSKAIKKIPTRHAHRSM